LTTTITKRHYS